MLTPSAEGTNSAAAFRPACKPSRTSSMILATNGRDQRASGS